LKEEEDIINTGVIQGKQVLHDTFICMVFITPDFNVLSGDLNADRCGAKAAFQAEGVNSSSSSSSSTGNSSSNSALVAVFALSLFTVLLIRICSVCNSLYLYGT